MQHRHVHRIDDLIRQLSTHEKKNNMHLQCIVYTWEHKDQGEFSAQGYHTNKEFSYIQKLDTDKQTDLTKGIQASSLTQQTIKHTILKTCYGLTTRKTSASDISTTAKENKHHTQYFIFSKQKVWIWSRSVCSRLLGLRRCQHLLPSQHPPTSINVSVKQERNSNLVQM